MYEKGILLPSVLAPRRPGDWSVVVAAGAVGVGAACEALMVLE
jgi:hypothetical protein